MWTKLRTAYRFWRLPWRRQYGFGLALGQLLLAAWRVKYQPWSRLAAHLGAQNQETALNLTPAQETVVREVRWAIQTISRRLPYPPTCLMQALAAKALLAQYHIPATLYIGVAPQQTAERPINAHAWLRCGPHLVTGQHEQQRYRPLVWYG